MSSNDNDSNILILTESVKLYDKDNDKNLKSDDLDNSDLKKEFINIKRSTTEINQNIKKNISEISQSINKQENEIKKLSDEEILLNRHKIQSEIFESQKLLIDEYKQNNENFKNDLNNLEKKFKESTEDNRKYIINNEELKNTISRYIKHNKNLQDHINQFKEKENESILNKSRIEDLDHKIKYYQGDNSRLSNEIINIQNKYKVIKNNFNDVEDEKNKIFKQIQDLNNSLTKNNIVGTPFVKDKLVEDSVNSKVLNDIIDTNLNEKKKNNENNNNLDEVIGNIFK